MRIAIGILMLAFIVAPLGAQEQRIMRLDEKFTAGDTSAFADYCLIKTDINRIMQRDVQWRPLATPVLQERAAGDRLWLKLSLANPAIR